MQLYRVPGPWVMDTCPVRYTTGYPTCKPHYSASYFALLIIGHFAIRLLCVRLQGNVNAMRTLLKGTTQAQLLTQHAPARSVFSSTTALQARLVHCSASAPAAAPTWNLEGRMKDLSGFIERVKDCNTGLEELPTLTPFLVDGKEIGKVKPR